MCRSRVMISQPRRVTSATWARLARVPLALELAAAGLRVLDPAALLGRLDEILARGGPVDLPARQRTMRAALDWSYSLLSVREQSVLRRASVFVGGCTLAAAEAVVGGREVLESVERLTAQSLLIATASDDGGLRYGMLEPVGQYARSLLYADEEIATRLSHAEYFAAEAEQAEQAFHRSELLESLRFFDTEEGNLWSALEWAVESRRADLAGRLTWALFMFWWIRGRRKRGSQLTAEVLTLELSDGLRARALHAAAALSDQQVVPAETVEGLYLDSLALAERSGDQRSAAPSAIGAGLIALERGAFPTAESRLRRGLSAAQRPAEPDDWSAALAHIWLSAARRFQGDPPGAMGHANQALAITGRRGDTVTQSMALYNLAQAEVGLDRPDQARQHLVQAASLCQQTRDASNLSYVLDALATVELLAGAPGSTPLLSTTCTCGGRCASRKVIPAPTCGSWRCGSRPAPRSSSCGRAGAH